MNIGEFTNSNIIKAIQSKKLLSGKPQETILPSGSKLEVAYIYDDGISDAAKRFKMGFPLCIHRQHLVTKTITKPNGVKIRMVHQLENDKLQLKKISEKYPEGHIDTDYNENGAKGGIAWVGMGDIIWKFKGNPKQPISTEPFTDPEYALDFKEITNYIKNSATFNTHTK